ncbi:MAG: motility protein A [Planctomycetaceae bacterium]|nr:motility protein A [Planctomycetaceae bacterium]
MDIGTLVGFILGALLIFGAVIFGGHEGLAVFWNASALCIVFGGTIAALLIAFPGKSIRKALASVKKCFANPKTNASAIIEQIVFFAESARREGLLAQEHRLREVSEPFLAEGLNLIVDGLPPTTVKRILDSEIEEMQYRHHQGRNIILHCGKFAPAFGMVGTLIGLVLMLTQLSAETVGPGVAVAILTTLYGIIAANLFFLPMAEKLKQLHESELRMKSMIAQGVLAIQSGEHPRIIQMQLLTFLPPGERPGEEDRIPADAMPMVALPSEGDKHVA